MGVDCGQEVALPCGLGEEEGLTWMLLQAMRFPLDGCSSVWQGGAAEVWVDASCGFTNRYLIPRYCKW